MISAVIGFSFNQKTIVSGRANFCNQTCKELFADMLFEATVQDQSVVDEYYSSCQSNELDQCSYCSAKL